MEQTILQNDFVRTYASTTAVGVGIGNGIDTKTDLNGLVASSTIKTNASFLGYLGSGNISAGDFGFNPNNGGGIWGFLLEDWAFLILLAK